MYFVPPSKGGGGGAGGGGGGGGSEAWTEGPTKPKKGGSYKGKPDPKKDTKAVGGGKGDPKAGGSTGAGGKTDPAATKGDDKTGGAGTTDPKAEGGGTGSTTTDPKKDPNTDAPKTDPKPKENTAAAPADELARYDFFKPVIAGKGVFRDTPNDMNVLGVRGFMDHAAVANTHDAWNDTIYVLWVDASGGKHCEHFKASVDPGRFKDYYNAKGDAHLLDGQYDYKVGEHKGYTAMNQAAEVTIWRDQDKDGQEEVGETKEYQGYFGINIHAGGSGTKVGEWSAGCQVIWGGQNGNPFQRFMKLMKTDPDKKIKYTLVDSSSLPQGGP